MSFRWTVSQIGARQHFGVPRGFLHKDELQLLYTDIWCRGGHSLLNRGPKPARAFAGRYHPDIPNSKVVSFNLRALGHSAWFRNAKSDIVAEHLHYLQFGSWFGSQVARDLSRRELDPNQDMFFGFNTGSLETLRMLRERRIFSVVDQIDPARVEEQLIYEEAERWPGWQKLPGRVPTAYWERMDAEWATASIVLVNSNWSRQALVQQGVPKSKIVVIPPPYEPEKMRLPARRNFDKPITVLWLGLVNLRKGIQYLIEAARLLQHNPRIKFVIGGPILIADQAVKSAPPNMEFRGRITRTETGPLYRSADVFVLPTLSDGFAVSQLEAMSQALPVIATPNCGEVVTHGVDGLIVPAYDSQALAQAVQSLDDDRQLLREMSYRALDKSACFYLPRQVERLEEAVVNYRNGRSLDETQFEFVPSQPSISRNTRPAAVVINGRDHSLRVAVIQDGTRLQYAVPLALQRAGALRLMFSEGFMRRGAKSRLIRSVAGKIPSQPLRSMMRRRADEIPPQLVRTSSLIAVRQAMSRNRMGDGELLNERSFRAVGNWVRKQGIDDCNALFGFIRNIDPQLCAEYQTQGILTVGDQPAAPAAVEAAETAIQIQRWPDWNVPETASDYAILQQVESATWPTLDRIICGSGYVRDGLIAQGVNACKIRVLQYPIDAARYPTSLNKPLGPGDTPLVIGYTGTVSLRTGAPYFLEVAKRLKGERFRFIMTGPVHLPDAIKKVMSQFVEFVVPAASTRTVKFLLDFDMFLFPGTCDGSAAIATQAMATGLPVITSPNSGTVVRDGIDGFVRDYSDIDGMVSSIEALARHAKLRRDMGIAARAAAHGLSLENFGNQLVRMMTEARANPGR
jgi:glycosyltransferase involved in cell wall biosynthesis